LRSFLNNLFTERDNASFCIVRAIVFAASLEMLWRYATSAIPDHMAFSGGLTGLLLSIVAKNWTEK